MTSSFILLRCWAVLATHTSTTSIHNKSWSMALPPVTLIGYDFCNNSISLEWDRWELRAR